jgi:Tfp pilus assembly protein FimT
MLMKHKQGRRALPGAVGWLPELPATALACRQSVASGFSLIQLMIVISITMILAAIAIPSAITLVQSYRLDGDVRAITAELGLARMRASALGAQTRVNFNTTANTYQLEVNSGGVWSVDTSTSAQNLAPGDTFGYGSTSTPAGQQSPIAQGYSGESGCTCIYYNSRGIATDSGGSASSQSAIYITNGNAYAAVAVSLGGQPTAYKLNGSVWSAF